MFVVFYRVDGLYKMIMRRMLGGKSEYISRATFEVQRFPAEVINAITDHEIVDVTGSSGGGVVVHSGQGYVQFPSKEWVQSNNLHKLLFV